MSFTPVLGPKHAATGQQTKPLLHLQFAASAMKRLEQGRLQSMPDAMTTAASQPAFDKLPRADLSTCIDVLQRTKKASVSSWQVALSSVSSVRLTSRLDVAARYLRRIRLWKVQEVEDIRGCPHAVLAEFLGTLGITCTEMFVRLIPAV